MRGGFSFLLLGSLGPPVVAGEMGRPAGEKREYLEVQRMRRRQEYRREQLAEQARQKAAKADFVRLRPPGARLSRPREERLCNILPAAFAKATSCLVLNVLLENSQNVLREMAKYALSFL